MESSIEEITAGLFAIGAARGYMLALQDLVTFMTAHTDRIEVGELLAYLRKLNDECSGTSIARRLTVPQTVPQTAKRA